MFFNWNDSLNTGVEQIDAQHRHLVVLINRLYDEFTASSAVDCAPYLEELEEYVRLHFSDEEALLESADLPEEGKARHREAHRVFETGLERFVSRYRADSAMLSMELLAWLRDWLLLHIGGADRIYVRKAARGD